MGEERRGKRERREDKRGEEKERVVNMGGNSSRKRK